MNHANIVLTWLCAVPFSSVSSFAQPVIPTVWEINPTADIQAGFDPAFNSLDCDWVGRRMATDGTTLIIPRGNKGHPLNTFGTPGEFLVYRLENGSFVLKARNNDSVIGTPGVSLVGDNDAYGWSLDMQGNTLAVSAMFYPLFDDDTSTTPSIRQESWGPNDRAGAVFVYTRPDMLSDTWTLQQIIRNPDPISNERYGNDVRFHDNRMIVSTSREYIPDAGYLDFGSECSKIRSKIYIYEQNGAGDYVLVQDITPPYLFGPDDPTDTSCDSIPPIPFGGLKGETTRNISVDGDRFITSGQRTVSIYRYDYVLLEYELEIQLDGPTLSGLGVTAPSAGLGTFVDLSGDTMVIGTKKHKSHGMISGYDGQVTILRYDDLTGSWALLDLVTGADLGMVSPQLGHSVFISGDLVVAYLKSPVETSEFNEVIFWMIDRQNNELLLLGTSEDFATGNTTPQGVGPGIFEYNDLLLLSDQRAYTAAPIPTKVRAVNRCPQDLNSDGFLDYFDINEYMLYFNSTDPVVQQNADYAEPYGTINIDDLNHYIRLYNLGCP